MIKTYLLTIAAALILATQVFAATRDVSSREAKNLLAKNGAIYLLDVRTSQEFSQARLSGAVLIPIGEFERRISEVPKNKPILVYCAVGSRSKPVADLLTQRGYKEVYHMADGIVGWYRNGFPIQR
ncbi:MAG: rhodanese-like domain-containing protein [Desulfuromonadaceae bacterium GWB2_53_15]|nr:MAG: rhodanese-like domain-containing protein [Desulfuromonadales bacterium GWD2_54_10]OHB32753.1 MAG: rhodanese-like domain-containing protein [Desulfuromonadaceae bacterium GWB2_53_15]